MGSNAKKLYDLVKGDPDRAQSFFRQALQDPKGALKAICDYGQSVGLEVTEKEVKEYLFKLEDQETNQWINKARGGL